MRRLSGAEELQKFALVGGTSLALRFGHRLSVDLDFLTEEDFVNEELYNFLSDEFSFERRRAGATGISGFIDGVELDFAKYRYGLVRPPETVEGIRMLALEDVVQMKLAAITNRGLKKDFYDLALLIEKFGLETITGYYTKKYPEAELFMLLRSMTFFDDAEENEDPVSLDGSEWEEVKTRVRNAVKEWL
ncbi:MAG: nucleotidyl transferase AbiEii/AbiGii toxin family protein [Verrucomicrobiota bacterium]